MVDVNPHFLYMVDHTYYELIKDLGVLWDDPKWHPTICLRPILESDNIFWMIKMTTFKEDSGEINSGDRYLEFIQKPELDIQSCFYHIGRTNRRSVFVISDALPVPKEFVNSQYKFWGEVKNKNLLSELNRKFDRILSFEKDNPNFTKTRITDTLEYMIKHYS